MAQKAAEVLVDTTATAIFKGDRGWLMIQNQGPNALILTNEDGVANGPVIAAGGTLVIDHVRGTVFAKTSALQIAGAGTRTYGELY